MFFLHCYLICMNPALSHVLKQYRWLLHVYSWCLHCSHTASVSLQAMLDSYQIHRIQNCMLMLWSAVLYRHPGVMSHSCVVCWACSDSHCCVCVFTLGPPGEKGDRGSPGIGERGQRGATGPPGVFLKHTHWHTFTQLLKLRLTADFGKNVFVLYLTPA